jgi:membrane associated rhomboid family serine protease
MPHVARAGVGGNFVSASIENVCTTLVGASGAIFGFMGLFIADLVVNFESISWPLARAAVIGILIVFFVVNAVIAHNGANAGTVSNASHVGGLICGLFPSLLFLPNLRDRRLKAAKRELQERAARAGDDTADPRCASPP